MGSGGVKDLVTDVKDLVTDFQFSSISINKQEKQPKAKAANYL